MGYHISVYLCSDDFGYDFLRCKHYDIADNPTQKLPCNNVLKERLNGMSVLSNDFILLENPHLEFTRIRGPHILKNPVKR